MKERIRHIPGKNGRTFCGREVARVACIDLRVDSIESAECKACGRSDDRRQNEQSIRDTIEERRREGCDETKRRALAAEGGSR